MWYVYLVTNLINGKHYVGKAHNVEQRWKAHVAGSNGNTLLTKAIRKYGAAAFDVKVLETHLEEEQCLLSEIRLIDEYKANVFKWGADAGYNQTDGGDGRSGHVPSIETRKKISASMSGRVRTLAHRQALSHALKGKMAGYKPTPETLLKISEAVKRNHPFRGKVGPRKGMKNSPAHCAKISEKATKITPEQVQQCEELLRQGLSIAETVRVVIGVTRMMVRRVKARMS